MKAIAIIDSAAKLVAGDRQEAYGDPMDGMVRLAIALNAWLHMTGNATPRPLSPKDAAMFQVMLKIARSETGPLRMDNFVDLAGWAAVAGEVAARIAEPAPEQRMSSRTSPFQP